MCVFFFFFFKQKTAYEMRISDWSSDVCSSDLIRGRGFGTGVSLGLVRNGERFREMQTFTMKLWTAAAGAAAATTMAAPPALAHPEDVPTTASRSEERRVGKECVGTCRSRRSPDH